MSLNIDTRQVESILLADGWHDIEPGSFDLDAYEFRIGQGLELSDFIHLGGASGICATGFTAHIGHPDRGVDIWGPMTALLAVADSPMEHHDESHNE